MNDLELYENLADHLDMVFPVGVPKSPAGIKILMLLFNPEEAEIAIKLPFQNFTLDQARELIPEKSARIEEILDGMAKGGTLWSDNKPGVGKRYRLLPSVLSFGETPFLAGKETDQARELSPLLKEYKKEAYNSELARGVPVFRVIPVNTSLKNESKVLPFDQIKPMVEASTYQAVGKCACRQMARYRGEGCDHSLETCLHFDSMARYMVEQGMARELSKEETLDIIRKADNEGLVHLVDNIKGRLGTLCNCCGCCCIFLNPIREHSGFDIVAYSNYVSRVDVEECDSCGICEDRCPVGAIKVGDRGAEVNEDVCLGCGICTPTCESNAVRLELREEIKPPPEFKEYFMARTKQENP